MDALAFLVSNNKAHQLTMNNQEDCRRGSCKLRWRCVNKDADDPLPGPVAGSPRRGRTGRGRGRGRGRGGRGSVLCVSTKCQQRGRKPQQTTHTNNPAVRWKMVAEDEESFHWKLQQFPRRWPESTIWKNKSIAFCLQRKAKDPLEWQWHWP